MPEDRERPDDVAPSGPPLETTSPVYGYTPDPGPPPFGPPGAGPTWPAGPAWPAGAAPPTAPPASDWGAVPGAPPPGPDRPGPARPTGERTGRRRLVAAGVVVLVLVVVGGLVAYLITSGPGPVPTVSPAARSLLRASLAAAEKRGSFHYVSRSTAQGQTQVTVGDAGRDAGTQVITIGSDTFTVVVLGTACYFKGDAEQMVNQLGLSPSVAAAHNEQWISLAPTDIPYASVYAAVTTHQALADNVAFLPHRRLGRSVQRGQHVLGLTGPLVNIKIAGQVQKSKGTAHLYVTVSKPHLPVYYTERGTVGGDKTVFSITFSQWGRPVTVTAPSGAIPFATINTGTGPTGSTGSGGGPSLVAT
ncbi:MAG TPA: hypothetical protein VMB72_11155 [Acidimicrobiales bacterium]|nr:hypothetical protein [Acidimicrobiales bacterium]